MEARHRIQSQARGIPEKSQIAQFPEFEFKSLPLLRFGHILAPDSLTLREAFLTLEAHLSEAVVRRAIRILVAASLAASASSAPLSAAPKPLGLVLSAERARVGAAPATTGATLFPGDTLSTDAAGTLRIRVGTAQIYLLPNSSATLEQAEQLSGATLTQGTIGFSSAADTPVIIHAPGAVIRTRGGQPGHGQITVVNPNELLVSSYQGTLEVVNAGETLAVPQSSTARVHLDDPQGRTPGPRGVGVENVRHAQIIEWVVGGTIIAATVAFVVGQNVSPHVP